MSLPNLLVLVTKMTDSVLLKEIVMIIIHYHLMAEIANVVGYLVLLPCSKTQSKGDLVLQAQCALKV